MGTGLNDQLKFNGRAAIFEDSIFAAGLIYLSPFFISLCKSILSFHFGRINEIEGKYNDTTYLIMYIQTHEGFFFSESSAPTFALIYLCISIMGLNFQ